MVLQVLVALHYLVEMSIFARYNFTVSEFLAGIVDLNAVACGKTILL